MDLRIFCCAKCRKRSSIYASGRHLYHATIRGADQQYCGRSHLLHDEWDDADDCVYQVHGADYVDWDGDAEVYCGEVGVYEFGGEDGYGYCAVVCCCVRRAFGMVLLAILNALFLIDRKDGKNDGDGNGLRLGYTMEGMELRD